MKVDQSFSSVGVGFSGSWDYYCLEDSFLGCIRLEDSPWCWEGDFFKVSVWFVFCPLENPFEYDAVWCWLLMLCFPVEKMDFLSFFVKGKCMS